jgi:flagellar basal body rod protein FlgB
VIDFKNFRLNLFTHLFFWICSSEQSSNKSNTSAPKSKKTSSKTKPSLATMPDTPDARAPFKSAPADIPLKERDVINLEDESDKVEGNDVGVDISMIRLVKNVLNLRLKLRLMMSRKKLSARRSCHQRILTCF